MAKNVARMTCTKCGQKGFFKNSFGWCINCIPACSYCTRAIARWNGETMHPECARRRREGLPPPKPKSRPGAKKDLPEEMLLTSPKSTDVDTRAARQ